MKIKDLNFSERVISSFDNDIIKEVNGDFGRITVLDRMTGFGWRDVETGFSDNENKFWLASGGFSILDYPELEVTEAIEKIKENANNCIGV